MANYQDSELISCVARYRKEADEAKRDRMTQNKSNFDAFHLKQDWSYKVKGQSTEFLPKVSMAVEQAANFIQQGLVDIGDWWKVEADLGMTEDLMRVKPSTIYKLTQRHLELDGFIGKINEAVKLGLLGSLIIAKVGGRYVNRPKYVVNNKIKASGGYKKQLVRKMDKAWQLEITLIRHEDYRVDPTGRGLYEMQDIYMDYHEVLALSEGENAIYDKVVVEKLKGQGSQTSSDQEWNKARETGQNVTGKGSRNQIKLTEVWGTLLNCDGEVMHDNCVMTIANDNFVIQRPTDNPNWHGESPYVVCPIIRVPHSVWHKALMDAPTKLNFATNELFNLALDGGLMAVHGIKQIRTNWLEDASQVENGIPAGEVLKVNAQCPPGAAVIERVDTSTVPKETLDMMNIANQELNVASLTNDLRMGVASFRAVKATEVVEASQTINSMFTGMAKQIEGDKGSGFITPLLTKAWKTIAQHIDELDSAQVKALLGERVASELLAMGNEELFAATVEGAKFSVFGISAMLNKQKDFTKLTALLQTIGTSEALMEAFIKKYDFTKILTEIMRSLDISTHKIEADAQAGGDLTQEPAQPQQPGFAPGETPNEQSQIPQAGAAGNQGDLSAQSAIPATSFPESRATPQG